MCHSHVVSEFRAVHLPFITKRIYYSRWFWVDVLLIYLIPKCQVISSTGSRENWNLLQCGRSPLCILYGSVCGTPSTVPPTHTQKTREWDWLPFCRQNDSLSIVRQWKESSAFCWTLEGQSSIARLPARLPFERESNNAGLSFIAGLESPAFQREPGNAQPWSSSSFFCHQGYNGTGPVYI